MGQDILLAGSTSVGINRVHEALIRSIRGKAWRETDELDSEDIDYQSLRHVVPYALASPQGIEGGGVGMPKNDGDDDDDAIDAVTPLDN